MGAEHLQTQTRRTFLSTLAHRLPIMGGAALAFRRTGFPSRDQQTAVLATVKIADFPELEKQGGSVLVKKTPAGDVLIVCTGEGQYAAMSNKCPHRQCDVEVKNPTLIQCPCHRSAYKIDGTYVSGPAERSLKRFRVTLEGGVITVTES
ncbi:MAG: Rieske (2Fe-2S) iron-sulfur domain protein [Acidobacteria bacterium]|nr:Rieske (2Fe-2S) iron-sulfur domain protein [Acidobacteriota bacterium]